MNMNFNISNLVCVVNTCYAFIEFNHSGNSLKL